MSPPHPDSTHQLNIKIVDTLTADSVAGLHKVESKVAEIIMTYKNVGQITNWLHVGI